jgi:hypothetical protein
LSLPWAVRDWLHGLSYRLSSTENRGVLTTAK